MQALSTFVRRGGRIKDIYLRRNSPQKKIVSTGCTEVNKLLGSLSLCRLKECHEMCYEESSSSGCLSSICPSFKKICRFAADLVVNSFPWKENHNFKLYCSRNFCWYYMWHLFANLALFCRSSTVNLGYQNNCQQPLPPDLFCGLSMRLIVHLPLLIWLFSYWIQGSVKPDIYFIIDWQYYKIEMQCDSRDLP